MRSDAAWLVVLLSTLAHLTAPEYYVYIIEGAIYSDVSYIEFRQCARLVRAEMYPRSVLVFAQDCARPVELCYYYLFSFPFGPTGASR